MFYFCLYSFGGISWELGVFAKATAFLFPSLGFLRPWAEALGSAQLVSVLAAASWGCLGAPPCVRSAWLLSDLEGGWKADFGPAVLQLPLARSLASEGPAAPDPLNSSVRVGAAGLWPPQGLTRPALRVPGALREHSGLGTGLLRLSPFFLGILVSQIWPLLLAFQWL